MVAWTKVGTSNKELEKSRLTWRYYKEYARPVDILDINTGGEEHIDMTPRFLVCTLTDCIIHCVREH